MNIVLKSDNYLLTFFYYFLFMLAALFLGRLVEFLVESLQKRTGSNIGFLLFHIFILLVLFFTVSSFLKINGFQFEEWTAKSHEGLLFAALIIHGQSSLFENMKQIIK